MNENKPKTNSVIIPIVSEWDLRQHKTGDTFKPKGLSVKTWFTPKPGNK